MVDAAAGCAFAHQPAPSAVRGVAIRVKVLLPDVDPAGSILQLFADGWWSRGPGQRLQDDQLPRVVGAWVDAPRGGAHCGQLSGRPAFHCRAPLDGPNVEDAAVGIHTMG